LARWTFLQIENIIHATNPVKKYPPPALTLSFSYFPTTTPISTTLELKMMRWGLIPPWAKDEKIGDNLINTRAETISEKFSFKKPFLSQRCLIPADGFYEWQRKNKEFTPFRFTIRDNSFFCFAGIWEKWIRPPKSGEFNFDTDLDEPPPSQVIETFSIITTEANEMISAVHDRMPVIVPENHYLWWLDCRKFEPEFTGIYFNSS
jgi:putative SOS response-associated peptidase YedK